MLGAKMKTSELEGAALDWAVNQIEECCDDPYTPRFSTDWVQAGPIIEREHINLRCYTDALWDASIGRLDYVADGPTPLIAAMRCYVASKLGDEVTIPEEVK